MGFLKPNKEAQGEKVFKSHVYCTEKPPHKSVKMKEGMPKFTIRSDAARSGKISPFLCSFNAGLEIQFEA